jgi:hypothetical protein
MESQQRPELLPLEAPCDMLADTLQQANISHQMLVSCKTCCMYFRRLLRISAIITTFGSSYEVQRSETNCLQIEHFCEC